MENDALTDMYHQGISAHPGAASCGCQSPTACPFIDLFKKEKIAVLSTPCRITIRYKSQSDYDKYGVVLACGRLSKQIWIPSLRNLRHKDKQCEIRTCGVWTVTRLLFVMIFWVVIHIILFPSIRQYSSIAPGICGRRVRVPSSSCCQLRAALIRPVRRNPAVTVTAAVFPNHPK